MMNISSKAKNSKHVPVPLHSRLIPHDAKNTPMKDHVIETYSTIVIVFQKFNNLIDKKVMEIGKLSTQVIRKTLRKTKVTDVDE